MEQFLSINLGQITQTAILMVCFWLLFRQIKEQLSGFAVRLTKVEDGLDKIQDVLTGRAEARVDLPQRMRPQKNGPDVARSMK